MHMNMNAIRKSWPGRILAPKQLERRFVYVDMLIYINVCVCVYVWKICKFAHDSIAHILAQAQSTKKSVKSEYANANMTSEFIA